MCCLLVIMYSIGVVILSIAEKRLSAKLHILLVIVLIHVWFKITLEGYCRTLKVFYITLNCVLQYYLVKMYLCTLFNKNLRLY